MSFFYSIELQRVLVDFNIFRKPPSLAHGAASEAVGGAGQFCGMGDVLAGFFAAEARGRKNFCGIGELQGVEGAADPLHGG
jgi:hypothetical protein